MARRSSRHAGLRWEFGLYTQYSSSPSPPPLLLLPPPPPPPPPPLPLLLLPPLPLLLLLSLPTATRNTRPSYAVRNFRTDSSDLYLRGGRVFVRGVCVRACVHAFVCVRACVCVRVWACVRACVRA